MEILQLILRTLLSPFIFILGCGMMLIFPGWICLIMGLSQIIGKLLGCKIEDSYRELLFITFTIIIFPVSFTVIWIKNATLFVENY